MGFDINGFQKDTRTKYHSNNFDINGKHKARSFEDQKGKGYVDLPILYLKFMLIIRQSLIQKN